MGSPWFPTLDRDPGGKIRLFCFPYAGRGASLFHGWGPLFEGKVEVHAANLPGRERRFGEAPVRHLPELIEALSSALLPHLGEGRYALFGHSLGALVGYELARALIAKGARPPEHLFLSAFPAPPDVALVDDLHGLPRDELIDRLRRLGGIPPLLLRNPEVLNLILPTLRADFEMLSGYRHGWAAPLEVPATCFGGTGDKEFSLQSLERWADWVRPFGGVIPVEGGHLFIDDQAAALTAQIARVLGLAG